MAEAKKKDPAKVQLKNVRLSFADIYRAKAFGGARGGGGDGASEPKFSANFLIDPDSREGKVNIEKMEDAIDYAIKNKDWGGKTPKFPEAKLPLRDGENHDYDGYEGMMFVSASNAKKPRILDADKLDVTEGDDGAPYSGCFVDAIVRVWAQDNKFGKRINASLEGIRFRDDGDAFGAAPLDPDEFDDDDDRGSRRSSSKRSRDEDDDDRGSRRGSARRGRDDDEGEDDRRSSRRRGRDEDEGDDERRSSRRRGRDEEDGEDDRRSSRRDRSRDDEGDTERRSSRRSRGRDEDDGDDDRRSSRRRGRDEDDGDDRSERRSSRRRGRGDDDDLT